MKPQGLLLRGLTLAVVVLWLAASVPMFYAQVNSADRKTRLAIVGLDHDHVWGLLKDLTEEPKAELVAIADGHPELVDRAKTKVPATVKFYADYVRMCETAYPLLHGKTDGYHCR